MTNANTYTYGIDYNPVVEVVTRARGRKNVVQGFLSTDPLAGDYAIASPYQFAGNSPVMAVDVEGQHPGIAIGAAVGSVGGGVIGFFTIKGSFKARLKAAGKGSAVGLVSGAIIGSGAGLVAAAGTGLVCSTGILAGAGVVAGGAGSVTKQGIEILEGTRERGEFSEAELATDMLIGGITAPIGGVGGSQLAKETMKGFAKLGLKRSLSNESRRAWKSHIMDGLREQGYSNRALKRLARHTYMQVKDHLEKKEAIEYFKFSIETGTAVLLTRRQ